jgi:glycosyltransferase involved in cell wall biosynthesis
MVMGMHRSGTSALTGVLGMMGVDLGKTMMKPTEENPRGYFENQRVNEVNQRLLASINSSWDDILAPEGKWWLADSIRPLASEMNEIVRDEFKESPLFAIKDPRNCRLFPLWREVLLGMGIDICAVIPVRHPAEVAESLRLRHGFSIEKGLLLWMIHTISAELFTRDMPRVWVTFESLLKQTEKTVSKIRRTLDLSFPRTYEQVGDEIRLFLDPALKHFDHKRTLRSGISLPRLLLDWHRLLIAACWGDGTDRKTLKAMDHVREEFELGRGLFQPVELRQGRPGSGAGSINDAEGKGSSVTIAAPAISASEGWQWFREYREAAERNSVFTDSKSRKRDFTTSQATYHARLVESGREAEASKPVGRIPRIIHVIGNLRTGGSTRLVVDLFERLGHLYDQEVISADIPDPLHYDGFPFHDFSEPVTEEEISTFLGEKAPHIIHFHHWKDPWYEKVMAASAKTGAVIIENVNTPYQILRHQGIAHYVFVSRHAMETAAPVPENSSVIYPGSDGGLFSRSGPLPHDTIGMVYRLERDKLSENSIEPLIEVVRLRPATSVIVVGGGELLSSFRRQVAEAGLAGRFTFTGYVPYHDLPRWYGRFTVFAAPVWNESFGQVVPFAMAMGIPVAGYRVGALPEILGANEIPETGVSLVKTKNQLTDAIIKLLDDRSLQLRLGDALRERFNLLFNVEAMAQSYNELYSRVLASRSEPVSRRRAGSSQ